VHQRVLWLGQSYTIGSYVLRLHKYEKASVSVFATAV
jgi:hypothetical protein